MIGMILFVFMCCEPAREREREREKERVDKTRQGPCGMAFSTSSEVTKNKNST
jgi:hypothetical protein